MSFHTTATRVLEWEYSLLPFTAPKIERGWAACTTNEWASRELKFEPTNEKRDIFSWMNKNSFIYDDEQLMSRQNDSVFCWLLLSLMLLIFDDLFFPWAPPTTLLSCRNSKHWNVHIKGRNESSELSYLKILFVVWKIVNFVGRKRNVFF